MDIIFDRDLFDDDPTSVLRNAGWMWLGYLVLLLGVDAYLYAGVPARGLWTYHAMNLGMALLFLGVAHWAWLQRRLGTLYTPLLLVILAAASIAVGRIWMPLFPPGPLSNVEGMVLRLLPVLFIGLVITAWQYAGTAVVVYAVGTALFEVSFLLLWPLVGNRSVGHAVILVAVVRSISFLVVGYFINRLMQRLRAQQTQLAQANVRLVHYAGTLEQLTLSRERNRLARELHDTLAHTLSALAVQLETVKAYWSVDPMRVQQLLDQSLSVTRAGLNETRRALKSLRAHPLEDLGLVVAVRELAESAVERGKLTLDLALPDRLPVLAADVEQCVYRTAQEAIENAVRHAQARTLTVHLHADAAGLRLLIADDGMGMDVMQAEQNGHFGLTGLRERAQWIGADLVIESQPEQGTRVVLAVGAK